MAWRRIGVSAAGVLLVAGCASSGDAPSTPASSAEPTAASASPSAPTAPAALGIEAVSLSEEIAHVHGLVATDADTVVAGTHSGTRTVTRDGAVAAAGADQHDLMGMTGEAGTQRMASSGHPGPGSPLPNPVGLISSDDGGATWSPVSLQGQVDFHALAVDGSAAIGYGGGPGLLVSSDGGATWKDGARIQPAALAYSGDRIIATTESGLQVSTDGGSSFDPPYAPLLVLISAGTDGSMLGLDAASVVWSSTDDGESWVSVGPAVGAQAVAAFADGGGYAIGPTTLFVID